MKVLIIDKDSHEALRKALRESDIELVHNVESPGKEELREFDIVILCPYSIEDLKQRLKNGTYEANNLVVLYENLSDKFINYCARKGCVDVVQKPYLPEMFAKRIWSLIEGFSSEEAVCLENLEITINIEDFIKREIKKAKRHKEAIAFITGKPECSGADSEYIEQIVSKLRNSLRETDFATFYNGYFLVVLHGCGEKDMPEMVRKCSANVIEENIAFKGIVKDKFYNNMDGDELKEILNELINQK